MFTQRYTNLLYILIHQDSGFSKHEYKNFLSAIFLELSLSYKHIFKNFYRRNEILYIQLARIVCCNFRQSHRVNSINAHLSQARSF